MQLGGGPASAAALRSSTRGLFTGVGHPDGKERASGESDFLSFGAVVSACTVMRPKRPRVRHVGVFGISVARSHWGLGIGKAMCLAMLDVSRQVGVTKVNLETREDNVAAIRLYESVGFQREGTLARAIKIGERYYADVAMGICLD